MCGCVCMCMYLNGVVVCMCVHSYSIKMLPGITSKWGMKIPIQNPRMEYEKKRVAKRCYGNIDMMAHLYIYNTQTHTYTDARMCICTPELYESDEYKAMCAHIYIYKMKILLCWHAGKFREKLENGVHILYM